MSDAQTMNITVYSRSFALKATPEKAPVLVEAAAFIHNKMHEVAKRTGSKDFERLVIAASMNIVVDYDEKLRSVAAELEAVKAQLALSKKPTPAPMPVSPSVQQGSSSLDNRIDEVAIGLMNDKICRLLAQTQ